MMAAEPAYAERKRRSITSGNIELDKKMGGGIPEGSLSLIEGQSDAGKSVLVQQLSWGGLLNGFRVLYYTTENTCRSLLNQMQDLGLDIDDYFLLGKINIYAVPQAFNEEQSLQVFQLLRAHIGQLQEKFDVVIVDSLTTFVSHVPDQETLTFFTLCKDFCDLNKTLIFTMHSYAFSEQMFIRLRSICDAHMRLSVEEVGDQLVKVLEVTKIRGAEKSTGNIISFEVEPNLGMRIVPITKAKA
jgi:flagellar protein FlaH